MEVSDPLKIAWAILVVVSFVIHQTYYLAWLTGHLFPLARQVRLELYWLETRACYPIVILSIIFGADTSIDWLLAIVNVLLWLWFFFGHDDDDRWKKRRKKAAAKIKAINGKLVVVPTPVHA